MKIGNRCFDTRNHTYIMGILNVTPDSFSDGGQWNDYDMAMRHAEELVRGGSDVLDVGGESTRPGHVEVPAQEEIDRVAPVIRALKENFDVPVSVDTWKSQVAEEALKLGADLVNDVWGFRRDPRMAETVKKYNAACCLMHNRAEAVYENLLEEIRSDLKISLELAKAAGIEDDRIMLDPGLGFGKHWDMNLEVLGHLDAFKDLGYPLLLGASRKGTIGKVLDLPVDQREEGTLVTTVLAVQAGFGFVRVHDAEKNRRAIRMTEAILGRGTER